MANGETPNPVLGVQVPPPLLKNMNIASRSINFLREVKAELGKVSWSTREELMGSTAVVIVLTSIIAVFIFIIDSALAKILSMVFKT